MKVSEKFLKVKGSKDLVAIVIQQYRENINDVKQIIRLCIEEKSSVTGERFPTTFLETDTQIIVNSNKSGVDRSNIKQITFHESVYSNDSHIRTFLGAIKKDSDVWFKVTAFNGCEAWNKVNFVSHQLYGYIDGKGYFLSTYIGNDNSASPVKY